MDPRLAAYPAVLFDLDGVLTDTAGVHSRCWKRMFDDYLRERAESLGEKFVEFDVKKDYLRYVDGKPRYDGVRSFLASRHIELPDGDPSDPPGTDTICALGNRKNALLKEVLAREGVEIYPGSLRLLDELATAGVRMAVVSSSKNTPGVLAAAGISDRFEVVVDGSVAARQGLRGKPAPDTFLYAAERLGVAREDAVVVEDSLSGVAAGRNGEFGLVIGVARDGNDDALKATGADLVVESLGELTGKKDSRCE
jgi:beta-phosphoglucomutase family hydrolase